jgi:hypothetical protein
MSERVQPDVCVEAFVYGAERLTCDLEKTSTVHDGHAEQCLPATFCSTSACHPFKAATATARAEATGSGSELKGIERMSELLSMALVGLGASAATHLFTRSRLRRTVLNKAMVALAASPDGLAILARAIAEARYDIRIETLTGDVGGSRVVIGYQARLVSRWRRLWRQA